MNTNDMIEKYAQRVVEDMSVEDLMNEVKESIIARLEDLPVIEVEEEINSSIYANEFIDEE